MSRTLTSKELSGQFQLSERQCRNYLAAIRERHGNFATPRGTYPTVVLKEFAAITKIGVAAYRRQTQEQDTLPKTTRAIVPTVIPSVTPYSDGSGLSSAVDVLALARERLAMQRRDLNQREQDLDQRASERDNALRELYRIAAENEAQRIALDRREIFDRALDRQLGDAASRTLWEQPHPPSGNAQAS